MNLPKAADQCGCRHSRQRGFEVHISKQRRDYRSFPCQDSASEEPSLPTLLGHTQTAVEAAELIQLPHYSGHGGQANSSHRLTKQNKTGGWGMFNRMQKDPRHGGWHGQCRRQTAGAKGQRREDRVGRGDPEPLTSEGENKHSGNQEQF